MYSMSTIESGIYIRLIIHIYEAGGRLEDKTSLLATISGLSELEFSTHWTRLKSKFVQTGDYIIHKRCLRELQNTNRIVQASRKGGINSAKARSYKNGINNIQEQVASKGLARPSQPYNDTNTIHKSNITNTSDNLGKILNKTMTNMGINTSDSFLINSSPSGSSRSPQSPQHLDCREHESREGDKLLLYGALQDFFNIRSNADRTALDNICKWAVNHPQASKEFYRRIIDLADEARKKAKTNRWGYFFDVLRRQLGYVPGKTVN